MATSGIGQIAMAHRPTEDLTSTVTKSLGNNLAAVTGSAGRMPNSIFSLSPENPTLKILDKIPIRVPHHTILGDRGKGDSPNSSDGIVPYWSSHLDSAQSEKIVPGPHGSCELPETIEELKRILHLHLKTAGRDRRAADLFKFPNRAGEGVKERTHGRERSQYEDSNAA